MLIEMTSCPFCNNGHNTPCFAKYDDGYKCFTCGAYKKADRSFTNNVKKMGGLSLPKGIKNPTQFSYDNLKWLYSYYIDECTIRRNNIAQLDDEQLLFPIIKNNEVLFYIERWNKPKKIRHRGVKQPILLDGASSKKLIIVEDWISAIRVSEHYDTLCLFGLYCPYKDLQKYISRYDEIFIWLDGDAPGQQAASKLYKLLVDRLLVSHKYKRSFDKNDKHVYNVKTSRDPKAYSPDEIKEGIQNYGQILN